MGTFIPNQDPRIKHAIDVILETYGVNVSVQEKKKDLNKFGFTLQCQTTETELQRLPSGIYKETEVFQNLITTMSSDNSNDLMILGIEGFKVGGVISVTSITQAAGVATCTAAAPHLGVTGDWVYMEGANETGYNGIVQITVTGASTFTYTVASGTATPATGTITTTNQNKTFVSQEKALNGTSQVTLDIALKDITRMYVKQQNRATTLLGTVYFYETDTTTAGVPNTLQKVHLMNGTNGAINNSLKAKTALSSTDFWIVTSFQAHFSEKIAGYATAYLQKKLIGGVWSEIEDIEVGDTTKNGHIYFEPFEIIPANSEARLIGTANANGKEVGGSIRGYLAKII